MIDLGAITKRYVTKPRPGPRHKVRRRLLRPPKGRTAAERKAIRRARRMPLAWFVNSLRMWQICAAYRALTGKEAYALPKGRAGRPARLAALVAAGDARTVRNVCLHQLVDVEAKQQAEKTRYRTLFARVWRQRPENQERLRGYLIKNRGKSLLYNRALRADDARREQANAGWRRYYRRRMAKLAKDPEAKRRFLDLKNGANKRCIARHPGADKRWQRIAYERLKQRVAADPEFAKLIRARRAASMRNWKRKKRLREQPSEGQALMLKIQALIPEGFPADARGDLTNIVFLAVYENRTTLEKLRAGDLKRYMTEARRMLPDQYGISLDDVIPGTDGLTYLDTLADDCPHL